MDEVEKWGSRLRAESTKTIYTNAVKNFLRHYHSTAEESMTWEVERAEDHLIEYQEHLLNSGYAGSTTRLMISALRRWFLDHRVRIVMVSRDVPVLKTYLDYIPNREDVQKCLDDLRLHYKVGLALVAFAGLRPSDAVSLQYKHIRRSYTAGDKVLTLVKQHQKTREWYVSFLGSQGTRYLRLLLDQRIRKGEELHDDLYIVSLKGRKLKGNSLGTAINRAIVRRIGKHPTNEPFRVFRPYGFRKFFRRAVSQLGQSYAEYLMGHTSGLRSLSATYNGLRDMDPTAIAALKREYVKVLSELETEVSDISLKAQLEKQQKEKEALADQIRVIQEGQAELRAFLDELAKRKD